jgi:hypothetical protein
MEAVSYTRNLRTRHAVVTKDPTNMACVQLHIRNCYLVYSFSKETNRWGPYVDKLKQYLVKLLDVNDGGIILGGHRISRLFGVRHVLARTDCNSRGCVGPLLSNLCDWSYIKTVVYAPHPADMTDLWGKVCWFILQQVAPHTLTFMTELCWPTSPAPWTRGHVEARWYSSMNSTPFQITDLGTATTFVFVCKECCAV